MIDLQMRPATIDDIPELLRFWQSSAENDSRPVDSGTAVRRVIERDPDALVVAVADGEDGEDGDDGDDGRRIVGSIIAGWDGWRCHLYRLAVSPEFRRQGLGRRLIEHAEQRLTALGATRIDAMVLDGNDLGQSIWRSAGYTQQPEWSRWVKPI